MSWFEHVHATLLTSTYTLITADVNDEVTIEQETEETQQYYGTKMSSAYVPFALYQNTIHNYFFFEVGGGGLMGVLSFDEQVFWGGLYDRLQVLSQRVYSQEEKKRI